MKTLQPRKCLAMNFLPIPRFVALVLALPPMPIYLGFRKNFCYGTGNLGSACIMFKISWNLSKLMNLPVIVIKYVLSSTPSSSLLQISRNLLFVSPVNWRILNAVCQKFTNQWRLVKIEKELCLGMPMKLAILFLLINMLSTHQANCFQFMREKHLTINFMVVHSFMMRLLV